jgi:amino-acid N-acetyltransferase
LYIYYHYRIFNQGVCGVILRKAVIGDVDQMHALISHYASQGLMLPRSHISLYETIHCFTVIEENGSIQGVAGLHILWHDLSEIRSLAVAKEAQGKGYGSLLVNTLVEESFRLGVPRVLALTYQTSFFERLGFQMVQKETLPHKVWKDCINCAKFPSCDEIAYLRLHPSLLEAPSKNVANS